MPRSLRIADGGFCYHVLNRGVGRRAIFERAADYAAFLRAFDDVQQRIHMPVVAYCLMPNHWHLVVRPAWDGELSEFMRLLGVTHTQRFHAAHRTSGTGPIYQGRFKSFPIQGGRGGHALTACRYVERNAMRAGLVDTADAWPWGSAHARYRSAEPRPTWLLPQRDWPCPPGGEYLAWLNAPQTAAEEDAIRTCLRRGRPMGTPEWTRETADRLGLTASLRRPGRPRRTADAPAPTVGR